MKKTIKNLILMLLIYIFLSPQLTEIYAIDISNINSNSIEDFSDINKINVIANRYINTVILQMENIDQAVYTIERGESENDLKVISEGNDNIIFIDSLDDENLNIYYRVTAYVDGIKIGQSDIINLASKEDSDKDGLPDDEEYIGGTDPYKADTDDDGLSDYEEIYIYKTNPLSKDTDNDNLTDFQELICNTDPLLKDTDGNGITDDLEDFDHDGRTNYEEFILGNDPLLSDSDFEKIKSKTDSLKYDSSRILKPTINNIKAFSKAMYSDNSILINSGDFYDSDKYLLQASNLSYLKTHEYAGKHVSELPFSNDEKELVTLLNDWTIINSVDSYNSTNEETKKNYGFGAIAIKKDNNIIISFEGSNYDDFVYDWIYTDGGNIVLGLPSVQLLSAYRFIAEVLSSTYFSIDCNLYITGHSLGAWLANKTSGVLLNPTDNNINKQIHKESINLVNSYVKSSSEIIKLNDQLKKCVTFASPGFTNSTKIELSDSLRLAKIFGYKYKADPVSKFGQSFGNVRWSNKGSFGVCHKLITYYNDWDKVFFNSDTSKYTDTSN